MTSISIEIVAIFVLPAVKGVFAMTEIAVVSARRLRLKRFADQGDEWSQVALELVHSPNRLLSTVQIGITRVGVMAGAFGGATIAEKIRDTLQSPLTLARDAEAIGLAIVVIGAHGKHQPEGVVAADRAGQCDRSQLP
ncbi:MAG TPA: CNNM domain-containing protein [Verrucomicrobiota bacterium]|nr:CNNM domain-containing protein [Verrucomicrobiota bacterium]HNT15924.1 CNNM domain-containing protein [Verrucomicrobiota bacterium]